MYGTLLPILTAGCKGHDGMEYTMEIEHMAHKAGQLWLADADE